MSSVANAIHSSATPDLTERFGDAVQIAGEALDGKPSFWVGSDSLVAVLRYLLETIPQPYEMLFDITAIDERVRQHREGQPPSNFTVVYHLYSFERNQFLRVKVATIGDVACVPSVTSLWPNANWYEREVWDMFGIRFEGHPNLRRILMPNYWEGHPLRKEHPARATEMGHFHLPEWRAKHEAEEDRFNPAEWGFPPAKGDQEFMYLNIGPQHPGTHGVLRIVLMLDGEEIVECVPEIGYHHRGAEKMGERQTWHTYIPYTDRIDYLAGVQNNLPYLLTLEKMAGIELPPRAQVIRVMLCELFRIASHLVWYGTFAQDLGQMSPVFYMFNDREKIFDIIQAICGGRMHPSWFRIGGVAQDLPNGWQKLVREFLDYMPRRLNDYDKAVLGNQIIRARIKGIGAYDVATCKAWGATGPHLRASGLAWDLRKQQPYSGYDQFDFEIPTETTGDCFARARIHVEEMRQSLRIVEQCLNNMPEGDWKSRHPLATPPMKPNTMKDIETLINHFLGVSWGPVMPAGEAMMVTEAPKGWTGYYLVSDGSTHSYRTRIRTPSFAHMQMLPMLVRGMMVPDLLAILGVMDFVLADLDR